MCVYVYVYVCVCVCVCVRVHLRVCTVTRKLTTRNTKIPMLGAVLSFRHFGVRNAAIMPVRQWRDLRNPRPALPTPAHSPGRNRQKSSTKKQTEKKQKDKIIKDRLQQQVTPAGC